MILHILSDSFICYNFVLNEKNLKQRESVYLNIFAKSVYLQDLEDATNLNVKKLLGIYKIIRLIQKSDKIIIHGLNERSVIFLLFFFTKKLKKAYWFIWGADLYNNDGKLIGFIKYIVARRIKHYVTYIESDYKNAIKKFRSKSIYRNCLMYTSNIFQDDLQNIQVKQSNFNVLVGNSASLTNKHLDALNILKPYSEDEVNLIIPFSYGGTSEYRERVKQEYKKYFGNKVLFLDNLLTYKQYREILNSTDLVIFSQQRQEGMGNLISLLGFGKTVYLDENNSAYDLFRKQGLTILKNKEFALKTISDLQRKQNIDRIKEIYSLTNLNEQLDNIYKE